MLKRPPLSGAQVLGFGAARGSLVLDSQSLGAPFGKDAAWVETRTGIRELRRVAAPDEIHLLAAQAAHEALARAELESADIDLVISASCSVANGPNDCGELAAGMASRAAHVHLNAACSGFCYALANADAAIRTGAARRVLVVAAEQMSRLIDPADLGTSIIFGDGAGAAVVGACTASDRGIGPTVWGSDGAQSHLIDCGPVAGGHLQMAGSQVFRWAVEQVPPIALEACRRAGVPLAAIDVFVPHQANKRIIDAVVASLRFKAIVADSVTTSGNTSAASIPIAVVDLARRGVTRAGQLALLVGFGAGLSFAAQVIRLP